MAGSLSEVEPNLEREGFRDRPPYTARFSGPASAISSSPPRSARGRLDRDLFLSWLRPTYGLTILLPLRLDFDPFLRDTGIDGGGRKGDLPFCRSVPSDL